ncbi:MAG TPA: ATP phosphoribosyltransferase regulatory subunit [Dehalococcoidia bacterium]|nr:ATP phosphoribosyltransferase regulatory subunit [Dehalococcoidia bacterium]
MTMEDSLRCPGMKDLLPGEMARFRKVESVFREACLAWGYQEIRTPTIERLHLFTGAGTLSPQMLGRVYSFLDWDGWSGERVVLRPDATIPAARLYVEQLQGEKIAKLFYVQNVFRFAQGDESREDWQCGAELIGATGPEGDIELALLAKEALERLGLSEITVRLSHSEIVRAVLAKAGFDAAEQLRIYDRILDGDASAFAEIEGRLPELRAPLEVLLGTEGLGVNYLGNMRASFSAAVPELAGPLAELGVIAGALEQLGTPCLISATLARNFEYYTGPVFRFSVGDRAVGGGGRYDSLISLVSGGLGAPASGFALEAEALMKLIEADVRGVPARRVMIEPEGDSERALAEAFRIAQALRKAGLRCEMSFKQAGKQGLRLLVKGSGAYKLTAGRGAEQELNSPEAVIAALQARKAGDD